MAREYEPVVGQWYEDVDENESFRVLSVDEDAELIEIEYLDGEVEEIDLETWHELDLDKTAEPEGWAASHEADKTGKKEEDDDDDLDDDTWDEDEDDEDEDDDDDDDDDEDWDEEGEENDHY